MRLALELSRLLGIGIPIAEALRLLKGPELGDGTLADALSRAHPGVAFDALREAEASGLVIETLEAMGNYDPARYWESLARFLGAGISRKAAEASVGKAPSSPLLEKARASGRDPAVISSLAEGIGRGIVGLDGTCPDDAAGRLYQLHLWMLAGATLPEAAATLGQDFRAGELWEALARHYPPAVVAAVRDRAERDGDPAATFRTLSEALHEGLFFEDATILRCRAALEELSQEGAIGLIAFELCGRLLDALRSGRLRADLKPALAELRALAAAIEKGRHPAALRLAFDRLATIARSLLAEG